MTPTRQIGPSARAGDEMAREEKRGAAVKAAVSARNLRRFGFVDSDSEVSGSMVKSSFRDGCRNLRMMARLDWLFRVVSIDEMPSGNQLRHS